MSRSPGPNARTDAAARRAAGVARRRDDERLCALDYLTWGDEQGVHAKRCVHLGEHDSPRRAPLEPSKKSRGSYDSKPKARTSCAREYHPGPKPDEKLYEGTGIGTLFGLGTTLAWQLAGWNIILPERQESHDSPDAV